MNTLKTVKLVITIEWEDGQFGGRIKEPGCLFVTTGETVGIVIDRLLLLVEDYFSHEGKNFEEWQDVTMKDVEFELVYELGAFFEMYKELKISAIAKRAGLNTNLLQQYVSGNKQASEIQAKKIEHAVHELGKELIRISLA